MADIKKALRDLADLYEREEEGESSKTLQARIDALEAKLDKAPKADAQEAIDDLTDEEVELIRSHRSGALPPPRADPPPKDDPKDPPADPPAAKKRPGRKSGGVYSWTVADDGKVSSIDIPTIYSGPDEPDEVELPEEATG